jgi:RHS repeat-associated protein
MTATVPSQGLSSHLTKYEYDNLYQLVKATYPNVAPFNGEVDSWTYDAIGNRLTNTVNGSTQSYVYGSAPNPSENQYRLISDGVNSYSHDANGSVVSKSGPGGSFTFGWSYDNRLSGISGAASASYGYDYQGRRSSKTVSGSTAAYLYDGLNLVSESGAPSAYYLFGPGIDEPVAVSRGGQVSYYVTDALGSVNVLTNSSGAVQNSYLYDAWGQNRGQTGSAPNPFTYTSREAGEAGTLFYRARYYGPGLGRFLSEDSSARENLRDYAGGLLDEPEFPNPFVYVYSRPVIYVDPLGLCPPGGPCDDPTEQKRRDKDPCRKPFCTFDQCEKCCIKDNKRHRKMCEHTREVKGFCKEVWSGRVLQNCLTGCFIDFN